MAVIQHKGNGLEDLVQSSFPGTIHCRMHPKTYEPWIYCAVCKGPVERIERFEDIIHDGIVFKVWCHGSSETVLLPNDVLWTAETIDITEAFNQGMSVSGKPAASKTATAGSNPAIPARKE